MKPILSLEPTNACPFWGHGELVYRIDLGIIEYFRIMCYDYYLRQRT